jgi:hypothetical protein
MRNAALLSFFLLIASVSALSVVEVYQLPSTGLPFSLMTNSYQYFQGQVIDVTGTTPINAYCDNLAIQFAFVDANSKVLSSTTVNLGAGGYFSSYYHLSQSSASLPPGQYQITAQPVCTQGTSIVLLGADGYADSNTAPEFIYVTINALQPSSTPLPPTACQLTCTPGFKLVNPSNPACYCIPAYTLNNGICEIGEPIISADCVPSGPTPCPAGQYLTGGLCIPVSQPPASTNDNTLAILGLLGMAGLAAWFLFFEK